MGNTRAFLPVLPRGKLSSWNNGSDGSGSRFPVQFLDLPVLRPCRFIDGTRGCKSCEAYALKGQISIPEPEDLAADKCMDTPKVYSDQLEATRAHRQVAL